MNCGLHPAIVGCGLPDRRVSVSDQVLTLPGHPSVDAVCLRTVLIDEPGFPAIGVTLCRLGGYTPLLSLAVAITFMSSEARTQRL